MRLRLPRTTACLTSALLCGSASLFAGEAAIVRGPYLQQGGDSRIVIRWRTDAPTDSTVIYGPAQELSGGASQTPAAGSLSESVHLATPTTEHEVAIESLAPNKRYYYAVGHGTGPAFVSLSGGDAEHFFDTAPSPGLPKPTRIWAIGDCGDGGPSMANVRDAYLAWTGDAAGGGANARHTEMWLLLGDNAYPSGTDDQYQAKFFDVHQSMLRNSVVWAAPGNHELFDAATQSFPYFDIFSQPTAGESGGLPSGTEHYYSFDYANVHVVSLDSALYPVGGLADGEMLDWLDADLADTDQQWIIAFFHHPPYSKGSHDSDNPADSSGRMFDMRTLVLPILESHGVDLVLTAHSHSYERSFLIDGHHGVSSTYNPAAHAIDEGDGDLDGDGAYQAQGAGTVYAVSGSSSTRATGVAELLNGPPGEPPHPVMSSTLWLLGSSVIDIDGNRLDARMLDENGEVQDRFTMFKGQPPQAPQAEFSAQLLTELAPLAVQFVDESQNAPTSWNWDFQDDGQIDSVIPDPSAYYTDPGLYSVRLTVSNSEGSDQEIKSDLICVTAGAPQALSGLRIGGDKTTLTWDEEYRATAYDVARGDLAQVIANGGEFAQTASCVGTVDETTSTDPMQPAPGGIFYYLVRGVNCLPQTGSYDTGGMAPGQFASRDLSMQGESGGCDCPQNDDDDGDGYCNAFDNCPLLPVQAQPDSDLDGAGDACDACPLDAFDDGDNDTICGDVDNCPTSANPGQLDTDGDLQGDACDVDDDGDGVDDVDDQAPLDGFACRDLDGDGCDDCSSGGDAPDNDGIDIDSDGTCDASDSCVDVDQDGLGNGQAANAGCAHPTSDSDDGNGSLCADLDGDGCDDCSSGPWDPSADGQDTDVDGICDLTDNCQTMVNPGQADADGDEVGDICDSCTDKDNDGFGNPGFPANVCPLDNCPNAANSSQLDSDADGKGDMCDFCPFDPLNDVDLDFICGDVDNCPFKNNASQADLDGDGIGNACDSCTDTDNDGSGNPGYPLNTCATDNCPNHPNPFQNDTDGDGFGNACDACPLDGANDSDGDAVCGNLDNCPTIANPEQTDSDADSSGNACDEDDDNDGVDDLDDCAPLLAGVAATPPPIGATLMLRKTAGMLQLDWTPVPQGHVGNVYVDENGVNEFTCAATELPQPSATLSGTQAPGTIAYYLVTPRNICGEPTPAAVALLCAALALDTDGDTVIDSADNCPLVANPEQSDVDGDWVGDLCDF